jgi:hypothetical protein
MKKAPPPRLHSMEWKIPYRSAILEVNKSIVRQRVSQAEQAVLARRREIFYDGTPEEKEALEHALYALRAYRTAWQHTTQA